MKPLLLIAVALLLQPSASTAVLPHFGYKRKLIVRPGVTQETCAILDASVFSHAASESLNDLRLYTQPSFLEVPFDLSISGTQTDEEDIATVSHLGVVGNNIVFDLKMPTHPYSAVVLALAAHNFIATAVVTGISQPKAAPTKLGTFALFDFASQHLSHNTTLPLQESTFPVLHIQLHLTAAPASVALHTFSPSIVQDAVVPPSREAQTLYAPVVSTGVFTQQGHDTIATFHIPAHVPVQRLKILFDPRFQANFLRKVEVIAIPDDAHSPSSTEMFSGEISRVKLPQTSDTLPIDNLQNSIEMPLGANLRSSATIHVRIHNDAAAPLPLTSAQLEMRRHEICFHPVASAASYLLLYGDPTLHAPVYIYAHAFTPTPLSAIAILGPEQLNPAFESDTDGLTFAARYPDLPWVMLLAIIATLGSMALRRSRSRRE